MRKDRFIDISLFYDWLEEIGRNPRFLINFSNEEILSFIKYIIERYKEVNNEQ